MPRESRDASLLPKDPRHGTHNGYVNHGCRCDRCRRAWRDYHREWMRQHPEQREKERQRKREYHRRKRAQSQGGT